MKLILFILLCCAAPAFGASSSLRISQLINFEAGANGEVVNDTESDTNTWNSMIQGNSKGGFERYILGGSGNLTIDTSLQVGLLRPITLASGTTYTEAASTRSLKMDDAATQAEYLRYWFAGGAKAKVSWGYFIKMNSWTADGNSYNMIFADGSSGGYAGFQFYNVSGEFTTGLETDGNGSSGVSATAALAKNKTYWVTAIWDQANLIAKQRIYDPVTWMAVTNEQTRAIESSTCRFLAIGRYDAHQHAPSGSLHWIDNLIVDDTGANYPMFPASAWVADSSSRANFSTVYTSSSAGEWIVIPASSNTWTSTFSLAKANQIISGVSSNTSIITNNCSSVGDAIFDITAASVTVSNLCFNGTNWALSVSGANEFWGRGIEFSGNYGVAVNCLFKWLQFGCKGEVGGGFVGDCLFLDNHGFGRVYAGDDGSANWTAFGPASSVNYGGTNWFVFERIRVDVSPSMPQATYVQFSSQQGQLWVIRNSYFTLRGSTDYDPVFDFHGPTSGGPLRGGIGGLLASNLVVVSGGNCQIGRFIDARGGSTLVYSNVLTGIATDTAMTHYRVHVADSGLYFQNSGVEQVTNSYTFNSTENGSAGSVAVESGSTTEIVLNKSYFTALPTTIAIAPIFPFPLAPWATSWGTNAPPSQTPPESPAPASRAVASGRIFIGRP